ncbi:hypothetical protein [Devosia elaeis]|uniref:hypothetical protein n=1 Tax=Devosia elaeis TaxID=1770058 RepID=UPI000A7668C9|nr:hypothetical protein [Devosia elaeis]
MIEGIVAFLVGLLARIAQDFITDYRRARADEWQGEVNDRMLEAGTDRPRDRGELVGRMRDGTF